MQKFHPPSLNFYCWSYVDMNPLNMIERSLLVDQPIKTSITFYFGRQQVLCAANIKLHIYCLYYKRHNTQSQYTLIDHFKVLNYCIFLKIRKDLRFKWIYCGDNTLPYSLWYVIYRLYTNQRRTDVSIELFRDVVNCMCLVEEQISFHTKRQFSEWGSTKAVE